MSATIPTSEGPREAPGRVLIVVAHPDDIDFGTAGTVAQLTAAGSHVAYCLVTSGEAGEDDMTVSSTELAEMREAEQAAAAAVVGVTDLHWLRHPDGMVEANLELRRDIATVIRIEKPDVVITQSPFRNLDSTYGSHPDHMETAEATFRAVYPDARNPRAFTSELLGHGGDGGVQRIEDARVARAVLLGVAARQHRGVGGEGPGRRGEGGVEDE